MYTYVYDKVSEEVRNYRANRQYSDPSQCMCTHKYTQSGYKFSWQFSMTELPDSAVAKSKGNAFVHTNTHSQGTNFHGIPQIMSEESPCMCTDIHTQTHTQTGYKSSWHPSMTELPDSAVSKEQSQCIYTHIHTHTNRIQVLMAPLHDRAA
jgi:hypothetical protein